jgi:SH3-like domain-containing protein
LLTGENVGVVARTADSAWLQVNTRFGTGWIARQFTSLNIDVNALLVIQDSPPFATVKFRQGVRIRMGPSTQYPVVRRFRQGIGLQVIGSNGTDWLQVLLPDGGAGWLRIDTVTLFGTIQQVPVLTVPAVAQIVSYRVRIRHDPTIASAVLSVGKLGQVYTVIGRDSNRTWWQIQGDFGTGWISATYVRVAGVPSSVPVVAR